MVVFTAVRTSSLKIPAPSKPAELSGDRAVRDCQGAVVVNTAAALAGEVADDRAGADDHPFVIVDAAAVAIGGVGVDRAVADRHGRGIIDAAAVAAVAGVAMLPKIVQPVMVIAPAL